MAAKAEKRRRQGQSAGSKVHRKASTIFDAGCKHLRELVEFETPEKMVNKDKQETLGKKQVKDKVEACDPTFPESPSRYDPCFRPFFKGPTFFLGLEAF